MFTRDVLFMLSVGLFMSRLGGWAVISWIPVQGGWVDVNSHLVVEEWVAHQWSLMAITLSRISENIS